MRNQERAQRPRYGLAARSEDGVWCAVIVTATILLSRPFAEMGFIDDWAYIKVAQEFARTGHVVYNGWETAMLGWLIPWGALFAKLFGFSFTAIRVSMLPVVFASVLLFHASMNRFGASRWNAALGTLTLGLSPLFFPLGPTFMTDVPGLFCILLCVYLCQRALQANDARTAVAWLVIATVTNLVGGTVRQIVWLGALVMVPSTVWLMRRRDNAVLAGGALWVVSFANVLACMWWFARQPYTLPERIYQGHPTQHMLAHGATELLKSVLCLSLVLAPLLISWVSFARRLSSAGWIRIAFVLLGLFVAAIIFAKHGTLDQRVMPWIGHIIGTQSIFRSTGEMLGQRPVTITLPIRAVISFCIIGLVLVFLEFVLTLPKSRATGSMHEAIWLLGPFALCYMALLVPRAIYSFIYDRYLLGVMPVAIVLLVLLYQRHVADELPRGCAIVVIIFGLYTMAATHDWFALNRARVLAVKKIELGGVPATMIQGGFDYDGWTQVEASGYINDERIERPRAAFHPDHNADALAPACRLNFASFTPAIHPRFFVVFQLMPCLTNSGFPAIPYKTWLPPFERRIYIQKR